jgi:hypothetical protein
MVTASSSAVLSLAELQAYDPHAPERGEGEQRFCCPVGGACRTKPIDADHRSISANRDTGLWHCSRCGAGGKLKEYWTERQAEPTPRNRSARARAEVRRRFALKPAPAPADPTAERKEWLAQIEALRPLADTPGAAYLTGRGIPPDLAHSAGVRYSSDWYGRPAALFPLRDAAGKLRGTQGRYTDGRTDPKARTGGAPKESAFLTPGALESDSLVITEAPLDALSLFVCGVPAVGPTGCKLLPEWLLKAAIGRRVVIATDADEEGDRAAAEWSARFAWAREVVRLRPPAKDWNQALQEQGRAGLTIWLRSALAGPPWDEAEAFEARAAAVRELPELLLPGAIGWAEEFRPDLLRATDAADAATEAAWEARDATGLQTALEAFRSAHTALGEAFAQRGEAQGLLLNEGGKRKWEET